MADARHILIWSGVRGQESTSRSVFTPGGPDPAHIGMGTVDAMPGLALAGFSLICLVLAVLMVSPGDKHQLVFVFGALCALALGKRW